MTTSPDPDNPDTEGKTLPPYDGRREAADPSEVSGTTPDAGTGGASAPTDDPELKSPDPDETDGGATGSPADEQPAEETPDTDTGDSDPTGPAHTPGTGRAEDQP
ncbi:hypothetical protein [Aeromicrobium sp.]|uniref:hypothetical protein n=1 Tax=Aeromicrobium sp. TaxID=1871063 RepID=UPI0030BB7127